MSTDNQVVIYSGGMDSFTLLNELMYLGYRNHILTFDYGQKHAKELVVANRFCQKNNLEHTIVKLPTEVFRGSALTGGPDVPEGHYEDESMKDTYVPNRNMTMLSLAAAYALSIGANKVFYGAHAGDHAIYPDCRPEFLKQINTLLHIANYEPVTVIAPYLGMSKTDILQRGIQMGLNYSHTWTCYNGRDKACGKCGSCRERLEAFQQCGVIDPLEYEDA